MFNIYSQYGSTTWKFELQTHILSHILSARGTTTSAASQYSKFLGVVKRFSTRRLGLGARMAGRTLCKQSSGHSPEASRTSELSCAWYMRAARRNTPTTCLKGGSPMFVLSMPSCMTAACSIKRRCMGDAEREGRDELGMVDIELHCCRLSLRAILLCLLIDFSFSCQQEGAGAVVPLCMGFMLASCAPGPC